MKKNIVVPAYFYPNPGNTFWNNLVVVASQIGKRLIVIANPNNGPGQNVDANYEAVINNISDNGGIVIGYVYTCYNGSYDPANPPAGCPRAGGPVDVETDIQRWYQLYPRINGIFFDQVSQLPVNIQYYRGLYDLLKTIDTNAICVFNPGQNTDPGYFDIGDSLQVIFEGSFTSFINWTPQSAVLNRSCVLLYETDPASFQDALTQIEAFHIPYVFITNDQLNPNPWDSLPPYFDDQVNDLIESCTRKVCGQTEPGNTNWQVYNPNNAVENDNDYHFKMYSLQRHEDQDNGNADTVFWQYPHNNQIYKIDPLNLINPFGVPIWRIVREAGNDSDIVMALRGAGKGSPNNGILILSLKGAGSNNAWLIHSEDDVPQRYFSAVDYGNTSFFPDEIQDAVRAGVRTPYFILMLDGEKQCPIKKWASLKIGVSRRSHFQPNGLYIDVDTSASGFSQTPIYTTSIGGNTRHWTTIGGNSVYNPSPTGFRVYLKSFGNTTPAQANQWGWHINWTACGM